MPPETIVCSRCGTVNAAGDQFCGSCGAFLSGGRRRRRRATTAPAGTAAPPTRARAAPDGVLAARRTASRRAPRPAPQAGFTVCPLRLRQPARRTFCHSAASSSPRRRRRRRRLGPHDEISGGLPRWLPIAIVAGLLVGVVRSSHGRLQAEPAADRRRASATRRRRRCDPAVDHPGPAPRRCVGRRVATARARASAALTGATSSSVAADTPDVAPGNVIDGGSTPLEESRRGAASGSRSRSPRPPRLPRDLQRLPASHDSFVATKRPQNIVVTVNGGPSGSCSPTRDAPEARRHRHARRDHGPDPDRDDVPGVRERLSRQPDRRVGNQRDPRVREPRRVIGPARRLAATSPLRPARHRTAAGTGRFKATLERAAYSAGRISAARVDSIGREDDW